MTDVDTLFHFRFRGAADIVVHAAGRICQPKGWRASILRDDSVLVHELVHHLQAANKVRVSCPAALERQAYALQLHWLREQSVKDPYDFAGLDVLTVIIAGSCPE